MHVAREADRTVGSTRKMDSMEEERGIAREGKREKEGDSERRRETDARMLKEKEGGGKRKRDTGGRDEEGWRKREREGRNGRRKREGDREGESEQGRTAKRARRMHMCSETNVRSECRLLPIIRCHGVPLCARGQAADSVLRFYAAR